MTRRLNPAKIAPAGMQAFGSVHTYLGKSDLPKVLIDLVNLRVSQINGCAYCLDMHTRDLVKQGVAIDKLALLQAWREGGNLFSDQERAALTWAETVTRVAETSVPDEAFKAVSAVFNEKDVADLTYAIALMNAYNRIGVSFRLLPAALERAEA